MGCICSMGTEDEPQAEVSPPSKITSSIKTSSTKTTTTAPSLRKDAPLEDPTVVIKKPPAPMVIDPQLSIGSKIGPSVIPNSSEAEHVAAGWPSWLASVAGDAIKGWLPRRVDSFEKLNKIGQGTYSTVYKARDLETGMIVALKKVRFVNADPESVRFMAREIRILRNLDHPNVIKLEGLITSRMSGSLYLVFEYMEHDLAGLAATPGIKFTQPQVKCYMKQLLGGLDHCHSHGVLHRDIKGSNLLIGDNGLLRIADFGLATFYGGEQKQPLTSRVVTLWYRPPELLLGTTEYGVSVDLWSSGCILAELLAGKPIMPGRTEVEQMHKIYKLCGSPSEEYWKNSKLPHATIFRPQHQYRRCVREVYKDFPSTALDLLDVLLSVKPEDRGTAASALNSQFFLTEPFACDPSSLPKYPPSKEFDAKLRDEARRKKAGPGKGRGSESVRNSIGDSQRMSGRDVISKFEGSLQQQRQEGRKMKEGTQSGLTQSSSLMHPMANGSSWTNKKTKEEEQSRGSNGWNEEEEESTDEGHVLEGNTRSDKHRDKSNQGPRPNRRYNELDIVEASEMQEWSHQEAQRPAAPSHKKNETIGNKDSSSLAFEKRKNRIHYSGPLMPPGGNMEEMLKEHERHIQEAVRKSRLDKSKTKGGVDN